MKTIKKDETYEPKIGETFIYDGKKLKCVSGSIGEDTCCECCLESAKRCFGVNCTCCERTDGTPVYFIETCEEEKQYQAVVNGNSFSKIYKNIKELKNNLVLKAGSTVEIKEIKVIETIVVKDVNEEIDSYEKAREYMVNYPSTPSSVIVAMRKLLTIAEAWNKADGFVIDWMNLSQDKFAPWFRVVEDTKGEPTVVSNGVNSNCSVINGCLCFKTAERAKQFGKQFIDLWNDFLLIK